MAPLNLLPHDGEVYFYPDFLDLESQQRFLEQLEKEIEWDQRPIKIFGKEVMEPRLTAFYGDNSVSYTYSSKDINATPWTETLLIIKDKLEKELNETFNCVLINFYRDGDDYMGWHRDNERELGGSPVIASVSLGAEREFLLRNYKNREEKISIKLNPGSLMLMKGKTQTYWSHSLPKRKKVKEKRINLTFRSIKK